jgi:hypothetical protein
LFLSGESRVGPRPRVLGLAAAAFGAVLAFTRILRAFGEAEAMGEEGEGLG